MFLQRDSGSHAILEKHCVTTKMLQWTLKVAFVLNKKFCFIPKNQNIEMCLITKISNFTLGCVLGFILRKKGKMLG